jgi:hypothetical protein
LNDVTLVALHGVVLGERGADREVAVADGGGHGPVGVFPLRRDQIRPRPVRPGVADEDPRGVVPLDRRAEPY